jgi:heme A synthase
MVGLMQQERSSDKEMLRTRLHRTTVAVVALAALALTASGVPDNKGTDAAIGWWSFVSLALILLALAAAAVVQADAALR